MNGGDGRTIVLNPHSETGKTVVLLSFGFIAQAMLFNAHLPLRLYLGENANEKKTRRFKRRLETNRGRKPPKYDFKPGEFTENHRDVTEMGGLFGLPSSALAE